MSTKARMAVLELQSTEQSYSKSLHVMMETYHKTLRNEQFKLKPILPEHDIDTIFGNVEDLMVIADDLREKLDKRIAETDQVPRVGDIMCTIAPVLKLYQKYVRYAITRARIFFLHAQTHHLPGTRTLSPITRVLHIFARFLHDSTYARS